MKLLVASVALSGTSSDSDSKDEQASARSEFSLPTWEFPKIRGYLILGSL